jgi:hypothetical protein
MPLRVASFITLVVFFFSHILSAKIITWDTTPEEYDAGDIIIFGGTNYVASASGNVNESPAQKPSNFVNIEDELVEVSKTLPPDPPAWTDEELSAVQTQALALTAPDNNSSNVTVNGLISLSVRGQVGILDDIRIMGFVLSGSDNVLLRGLGPVLAQEPYGISEGLLLGDPSISLWKYNEPVNVKANDNSTFQGTNNDYSASSSVNSIINSANPVVPTTDKQSVMFSALKSGFYTLHMQHATNPQGTGIGNAAVDLVNSQGATFSHLSSRGVVYSDEDKSIFGSFQISGTGTRKIFIRARGPSLTEYGIPGVKSAVSDPSIVVKKYINGPNDDQTNSATQATPVADNDNFEVDSDSTDLVRTFSTSLYDGWPEIKEKEAGLVLDLGPGYYSVQLKVSSVDDGKIAWIGIDDVTGL